MVKFKFSLALLASILLLPLTTAEIQVTANEESNILFVDSGDKVIFRAFGTENSSSILWDFGRNISGPDTRYSNLNEVEEQFEGKIYVVMAGRSGEPRGPIKAFNDKASAEMHATQYKQNYEDRFGDRVNVFVQEIPMG